MRRKHSEVTDKTEIYRILSSTNIGRMATIGRDGFPYITPVNYVSLDGNIYFHCAPKGEKSGDGCGHGLSIRNGIGGALGTIIV